MIPYMLKDPARPSRLNLCRSARDLTRVRRPALAPPARQGTIAQPCIPLPHFLAFLLLRSCSRATQGQALAFLVRPSSFHRMKVREVIRMIENAGWTLARTRGGHRQYKHPSNSGLVTVPGHLGDDLAPGTLNSILKQAGLKS